MPDKVNVSKVALLARLNRRLAVEGQRLRATRGKRAVQDVGNYYIISNENRIVAMHVDPVKLAREIGALQLFEEADGF